MYHNGWELSYAGTHMDDMCEAQICEHQHNLIFFINLCYVVYIQE